MQAHKTRGGVVTPHYKSLTREKPIEAAPLPEQVVIPLQMHTGAPAKPLVGKGDAVESGQMIGEPTAFISAAIHSSVDGIVKAVEKRLTPSGMKVDSVVIDVADEQKALEPANRDTDKMSPGEIVAAVKDAGLVGLGGAGFPTHVKLTPPPDSPIDSVIINGCECEPYLTCDYRAMLEETDDLLLGIELIKRAVHAKQAYIGIESDKMEAADKIEKAANGSVKVIILPAKYPQGAEGTLIKSALGRQVPFGKLPSSVGALVQNVGTTIAVARACRDSLPLTQRVITVSGPAVQTPKNLRFRIGTSARHLIESCGGLLPTVAKVVHGGPMMGTALYDLDVPMTKVSSGLIALDHSFMFRGEVEPCIRCGSCIDRCPQGLRPLFLVAYIEKGLIDRAVDEGLMRCIECGSCAYGCPGGRPMIQILRYGKQLAGKKRAASK